MSDDVLLAAATNVDAFIIEQVAKRTHTSRKLRVCLPLNAFGDQGALWS